MNFHQSVEKCSILTSEFRHQKTTSNLLRINLKCKLLTTRGSYVHKHKVKFWGPSHTCFFVFVFVCVCANSSKYRWFQTKQFTKVLEFIKLCKQIFTITKMIVLALIQKHQKHFDCVSGAGIGVRDQFRLQGLRSVARIFSPLLARISSGFARILHFFCPKILNGYWKILGGGGGGGGAAAPPPPRLVGLWLQER